MEYRWIIAYLVTCWLIGAAITGNNYDADNPRHDVNSHVFVVFLSPLWVPIILATLPFALVFNITNSFAMKRRGNSVEFKEKSRDELARLAAEVEAMRK